MSETPETLADLLARGACLQTNPYLISPYSAWRAAAWADVKAVLPPVLWEYLSGEADLHGVAVHLRIDVPGFAPISCSWHTYHKAFFGDKPFAVPEVAVNHPSIPEPFWNGGDHYADIEVALVVARDRGLQMQEAVVAYEEQKRVNTARMKALLTAEEASYDGDWGQAPPRSWLQRLKGGAS